MSRWSLPVITLLIGLFLLPLEAEARRFGGGMSGGQSYSTPQRQTPAPAQQRQQQRQDNAQNSQQTAGQARPGMGGMMGGLLAGGLLAALFMGGAFEGIQAGDLLLIALLALGGFMLFRAMRSKAQPQAAYAGAAPLHARNANVDTARSGFMPEPPVSGLAGSLLTEPMDLPDWFDKEAFVEGARGHFTHLQGAWDRQDWDEIADYTSAEMLALLKQERGNAASEQHTEVVSVMAELVNFIDNGDHVVASINFYGWLREEQDGEATEFSEIWHLNRSMGEQPGNWVIVGIEQPS